VTVIAWDGKTLAADKCATVYGVKSTVTKIFRNGDILVGLSGDYSHSLAMMEWLFDGRPRNEFPAPQGDNWGYMLAIHRSGKIERYEHSPYPFVIEDAQHANGSGKEFATCAMYLGKTAAQAVAIACVFCADCGMGIDTLTFDDPPA